MVYPSVMARLKRLSHELFAREYVKNGGNSKDAYLRVHEVYPKKYEILPTSYKQNGWLIKQRPEVRRRIEELRDRMAKRADITEDKILTDLQHAIEMAKAQAKPNDLVNASMAQAKVVGLLRDRVDVNDVSEFERLENVSDILQAVEARDGPAAALELARAFGFAPRPTAAAESSQDESGLLVQKAASDAVN